MNPKLILAVSVFLFLPGLSYAADPPNWENIEADLVPPFQAILCIIYTIMYNIGGPIGVLTLVWAGVKYLYARDDPGERERAKELIVQVVFALMLIIIAKPLAEFVLDTTFTC